MATEQQRLITEFDELAKQKLLIVESLPEKWANQYRSAPLDQHASMVLPAAAQQRPTNLKRPQSATAGMHGAILSEADIKKEYLFKECSNIVAKILRSERAKWFKVRGAFISRQCLQL